MLFLYIDLIGFLIELKLSNNEDCKENGASIYIQHKLVYCTVHKKFLAVQPEKQIR